MTRRESLRNIIGSSGGGFVPITITNFTIVLGYATITPILPLYASSLGLRATQVGIVIAAYGFARLTLDLVGGVLGDKIGFRRLAVGGCALVVIGALLSAFSTDFATLLAGQAIAGIGSAIYTIAAFTSVIMLADPLRKARMMGHYHTAIIVAFSLGPMIGGFVGDVLGLRAPFYVFAAAALIAGLLSLRSIPKRLNSTPTEDAPDFRSAVRVLLTTPAFVVSLLVIASGYMVRTGVRNTAVPIFATDVFAMSVSLVGILLAVAVLTNALVLPHAGRTLDRVGRRPVTIWSCVATTFVLLGFATVGDLWQLYLLMGAMGVVSSYAGLAPVAVLADVIDDRAPGVSVGLQRMGVDLGMVLGPLVAGVGLDYLGFRSTFLLFAGLMAIVAALSLLAPETASHKRSEEEP